MELFEGDRHEVGDMVRITCGESFNRVSIHLSCCGVPSLNSLIIISACGHASPSRIFRFIMAVDTNEVS